MQNDWLIEKLFGRKGLNENFSRDYFECWFSFRFGRNMKSCRWTMFSATRMKCWFSMFLTLMLLISFFRDHLATFFSLANIYKTYRCKRKKRKSFNVHDINSNILASRSNATWMTSVRARKPESFKNSWRIEFSAFPCFSAAQHMFHSHLFRVLKALHKSKLNSRISFWNILIYIQRSAAFLLQTLNLKIFYRVWGGEEEKN